MSDSFKFPPGFDPLQMGRDFTALGAASAQMVTAWSRAWQTMLEERTEPAVRAMLDPLAWLGQADPQAASALHRALDMPKFADLFSFDPESLEPAVELAQISQAYGQAAARVWSDVCRRFQERLADPETRPGGPGEALDLWNAVVDETLMAFNRSETFAELQRRFVRAAMRFRLERRKLVERAAEHYDLPTRTEVDALASRVHALERENRALRRQLGATPRRRGD